MAPLPQPSPAFISRKQKILEQLSVPDESYTDLSPKGSVDVGIRDLIAEVNAIDGLVTTSSCAGRVSVFLEGVKREDGGRDGQIATPGGKGAGGQWLFVSHDPVKDGSEDGEDWPEVFGLNGRGDSGEGGKKRLIHFKFEPMVRTFTEVATCRACAPLTTHIRFYMCTLHRHNTRSLYSVAP